MGIGTTLEECMLKSVRSLEIGVCHLYMDKFASMEKEAILSYLEEFHDDNIFAVTEAMRHGVTVSEIAAITKITPFFLEAMERIVKMEKTLAENKENADVLKAAKVMGFSDKFIAKLPTKWQERLAEREARRAQRQAEKRAKRKTKKANG